MDDVSNSAAKSQDQDYVSSKGFPLQTTLLAILRFAAMSVATVAVGAASSVITFSLLYDMELSEAAASLLEGTLSILF